MPLSGAKASLISPGQKTERHRGALRQRSHYRRLVALLQLCLKNFLKT